MAKGVGGWRERLAVVKGLRVRERREREEGGKVMPGLQAREVGER